MTKNVYPSEKLQLNTPNLFKYQSFPQLHHKYMIADYRFVYTRVRFRISWCVMLVPYFLFSKGGLLNAKLASEIGRVNSP